MKKKMFQWRKAMALVLSASMLSQNCMVTTIGSETEEFAEEVSVQNAEAEQQAAEAARQAEEARAAEEARQAEEAARQAEEAARQQEEALRAAEEAQRASEAEAARQAEEARAAEEARQAEEAARQKEEALKAAGEAQKASEAEQQAQTEPATEEAKEAKETAQGTSAPAAEKVAEDTQKETDAAATEKQEIRYRVSFDSHAADHGQISLASDGSLISQNGISSYYTEVEENQEFRFSVIPADGYEVEYVRAEPDHTDIPGTGNQNEYQIAGVAKDTVITVTYRELPKETGDAEGETEEITETEAPTADTQEADADAQPAGNGIQTFAMRETDHNDAVVTYYEVVFKDKDGNVLTSQQVASGESAVAPAAPEVDGYKFTGWDRSFESVTEDMDVTAQYAAIAKVRYQINYQYPDGTAAFQPWVAELEIGTEYNESIPSPVKDGFTVDKEQVEFSGIVENNTTETVTYRGAATTYTVKHMQQDVTGNDYTEVDSDTLPGQAGETTTAAAKEYSGFIAQDVTQATINAGGTTVVEIKYDRISYQLTWDTDGGSYMAPENVLYGAVIPAPETPTRLGYTFKGWDNLPTTMPAQDTVVKAKWEINKTATYKVIYWQESLANPDSYEIAKKNGADEADIATGTGTVGSKIRYTANENRYTGFEPDTEKNAGDVEITADGQAVKNVYYNRKTYWLKFYLDKSSGNWWEDGYWKEETSLKILAKYGEDISAQWNDAAHAKYNWATGENSDTYYTNFSNMPAENIEVYGRERRGSQVILYYIETLDGGTAIYQRYDNQSFSNLTVEDQQPIDGFTYNDWKKKPGSMTGRANEDNGVYEADNGQRYSNASYLYYTRNSYVLTFENCTGVKDKSIKFEAKVKAYKPDNASVGAPSNVESDYIFAGWYTSPACEDGTEFDWENTTMPSHTIRLYAKWVKPSYTVSFEENGGSEVSNITVSKYGTIEGRLPVTEKAGDEFLGWYTDANFTHAFVETSQIVKDTTLYAKWKSSEEVTYYIVAKDAEGKELYRSDGKTIKKGGTANEKAPAVDGYYASETMKSAIIRIEGQEIIFIYVPRTSWTYTIRYINEQGEDLLASEEVTTTDNVQTVVYKAIDGYHVTSPAVVQQKKPADSSEKPVVVFRYAKNTAVYTVEHYLQYPDGTYYLCEQKVSDEYPIGKWVTAEPNSYEGFTVKSGVNERSGAVKDNNSLVLKVYYNRNSLTIQGREVKYDGNSYTVTVTVPGIEGDTVEYSEDNETWSTAKPSYKNAGSYTVYARIENSGNHSEAVSADVVITKREITLTSASDEKVYDGQPLTKPEMTMTGDGFADGEGLICNVTGTQTEVGESKNKLTYTLDKGTEAGNYEITKVEGTLKVTPVTNEVIVTIKGHTGNEKYDGKEKTVTGYEVEISSSLYTANDFTFTGKDEIKKTDAGDYPMGLAPENFENRNKNFKKVTFYIEDGNLTIEKRTVTLTSATDSKPYDGTALTNHNVTVGGDGFADGEGATYSVTGTQTAVGESANTFDYTLNDNTKADNYEITKYEGKLTVTPSDVEVVVTITGNQDTVLYDGGEKTVRDYTVSSNNALYTADDFTFKGTAEAKGTDAGEYLMGLKEADFQNTNPNFSKVKFVVNDGSLKITKRNVTLTSGSGEKVYDGTALTNDAVTVSGNGFADGEGATYTVTGSQTNAGKSDNTFEYTLNSNTKADNYIISKEPGELEVTPVTDEVIVTIKGNDNTEKYDGTEKKATGYTVTDISNSLYTANDFTFGGTDEAKGTNAGSYQMGLKETDFTNTSANFTNVKFVVEDGTLTINPRDVTLTSADDEKVYDGTPLTNDTVAVSGDGFVGNDGATYHVTGSQTDAGESENTFTYELTAGTVAGNYTITTALGTLKVTPVTDEVVVNIKGHTDSAKYDGTEKTVNGYDVVSISNKLYTKGDFTFNGTAKAKGTDAGEYPMELEAKDFSNISKNFKKVTFNVTDGKLTVEKRDITLTSGSASKPYDGEPLTNSEVTVSGDGFVGEEGATYHVTGSQIAVGSSDNEFAYTLNNKTKASNYNITVVKGRLTVTSSEDEVVVTIAGNKAAVKYDGSKKSVDGYQVVNISSSLYTAEDFVFSGTAHAEGNDAGSYSMGLKEAQFTNTSDKFTKVIFVVTDGVLTIEKRNVTLTSGSSSKTYDGTALTNGNVTVGGEDGFAAGEGATYDVTGTQTNAGESDNTFDYTLNDNTKAENYEIRKEFGKLTVNPVTDEVIVKIKGNEKTETYDGTEKTVKGYKVTSISNPLYAEGNISFTGKAEAKGTNAGGYQMGLKKADFANTSTNFTNVKFEVEDGKLTVSPREITLTSATAEKVYDGTALTNDTVTVTDGSFVTGEGAAYEVTGSQTDAGESENTFTYELNEGTNVNNYTIRTVYGKLKVTPVTQEVVVRIKGHTGSAKYDGEEHDVTGYDVESISNPLYEDADFTFSGKAEAKGTDANTYLMGLSLDDFTNANDNFTNVTFEVTDGRLEITKRNVTLTSADGEKVYDGKPLTNHNVTVGGDGFVKEEGAEYDVTGSRTEVGTSDNAFTYTLKSNTNADNYNITKTEGKLTVKASENEVVVTIVGNSDTVTYDGKEHMAKGYKVTGISDELYTEDDFTFTGNAAAAGTDAGSYPMGLDKDQFINNNSGFAKVTFVVTDGTLTIKKREVTLTSASEKRVYNGTALTNHDITVSGDGFVKGEGASYTVTGSQTDVGKSDNEFTYKLNDNTKTDNYIINTVKGKLEVTPVDKEVVVTIKGNTNSVKYNGTEQTVTDYRVESITMGGADYDLYKESDFGLKEGKEAKASGTDAGTYPMNLTAGDFENTNSNFTNVKFMVTDGSLTITKRKVTLTSGSQEKVYDGTALTNSEMTVGEEDGFAAGEGATYDVTGSQLNVGESDNTFTYTLNEGTKADNYEITKAEGTLKVTPVTDNVTVTITGNTTTAKYDGTEKTAEGYTVNIDNKLYKETDFSFSGTAKVSAVDANSYGMGLKASDFKNISKNFTSVTFVVEDGNLTIAKREVTLTSATDSKVYDGKPLTNDEVTVTGDGFADGEGATYEVTGSQTRVGSSKNSFTYALNDNTKEGNYHITKEEGTLTVTASEDEVVVTIVGRNATVTYDGSEHTVTGYDVISIRMAGKETELYKEKDFRLKGTAAVSGKDVKVSTGTEAGANRYKMGLTADKFENINSDFTKVTFVVLDGYLQIDPRPVTLTSGSARRQYNGEALTNGTVTVEGEGFAEGEGAACDVTGSQTDVGKSANTFIYTLNSNTKADNYTITPSYGELEITPVDTEVVVTIKGKTGNVKYDGVEHTVAGYTVESITMGGADYGLYKASDFGLKEGKEAKASGTDADTYPMNLTAGDFENTNRNFTNVKFVVIDGSLTITKRKVTLTSGSDSKVYDGKPLTKNEVKVTDDGFAEGEGASYNVTGTLTNVGEVPNTFTYTLNEGTKADNYEITKAEGTLKVTPVTDKVTVTITGNTTTAKYDGTEKTAEGYIVSIDNELYTENDFSFNGKANVTRTDADIYEMGLKASDFKNTSDNFTDVTFLVTDGSLNITQRKVTLTSGSASKVYDGQPLTKDEVTVTDDGFADGEGATYNVTGSRTRVGSSPNTFNYVLNENTKAQNYEITPVEGTLIVTANDDHVVVTIVGNAQTEKYDGKEKSVEGYTVTNISSELYKSGDFKLQDDKEAKASGTDADTYPMGLKATDFVNTNTDFTNVEFVVLDGSLKIDPREVTLTSGSAKKTYDGTALTYDKVSETGDGFVDGEGAVYEVTGTLTDVGKADNEFTYTLKEGTKTQNYTITSYYGELEVTPVEAEVVVTIEGNTGKETYDGTEKSVTDYKVAGITMAGEQTKLYTTDDFMFLKEEAKASGTDAGTYNMGLTAADFKNISENFTNVRFEVTDGQLEIEKRKVTFQAKSASKVYDGSALTEPEYELVAGAGTLADGQTESVTVKGSQTLVGSSANTITDVKIMAAVKEGAEAAEDVTKNYEIRMLPGTLTVTDGDADQPVNPQLVVNKNHEGKEYRLNETVTFTITVKNIYDQTMKVTVKELEGVSIEGGSNVYVIQEMAAGDEITLTATYTITEEDIANGSFINTVTAEFEGGKPFEDEDTVEVEDPVLDYTFAKKASYPEHENGMVKAGESIQYTITVTNTGNQTLKNIQIKDTLRAAGVISNIQREGVTVITNGQETTFVIASLAPNTTTQITYEYVVLDADKGTTVSNAVVGSDPKNPDEDKPGEGTETTVEDPKLEVTKTVTAITAGDGTQKALDAKASLNDTITYQVTVKNAGNVVLTNAVIEDSLADIELADGSNFALGTLAVGEEKTVTYTYKVKEADLGSVIVNVASAKADVPEDPDDKPKPGDQDEKKVPTDDRTPAFEIIKEVTSAPADGEKYVLGETISYRLTVTNTGNVTLKDIVINDKMTRPDGTTGAPGGFDINKARIDTLAPAEQKVIEYSHVVTEADLGGVLSNAAAGTGRTDHPEEPVVPGTPDEEEVITEDPSNCSITVTKQTTNYLGEAIMLDAGASFQVALFQDAAMTQRVGDVKTLVFNGKSSTASVTFGELKRGTYYVAEIDQNGKVLKNAENEGYNGGVYTPLYPAGGQMIEIKENGGTASFDFANAFIIRPRDYSGDVATLTIIKKVENSKGKAMNSNDTFYAGIFADEACTQLADGIENIVALKMGGASSSAATVEVPLSLTGEDVQLYVAEVDASGNLVKGTEGFAWNVSVKDAAVTLNGDQNSATVVITNTSTQEETESECETNKTQQDQKTGNSANSVKTGDNAPLMMFVWMLGLSAMAVVLLAARRRREQED